ncbi:hypothetical protein ZIOFF_068894 [Zingiber officinale]|uniref:Leucine-rich repeat-containing N-terminal plant-type domain-containing protein n=1 Tax=Zingiber officinale TaxID=94328 RepID=A0A8J5CB20_ZINOF|nr:hypothetical protein ZIOFF_068894 [Zingiber officinale]
MGGQPKATTQQQTTLEVPNHMEENFALTEHFVEFSVQMAQLRMRTLFFWLLGGPIRLPTGRRSDDPIQVILWVGLLVIFVLSRCYSFTDERDVTAINSFYVALGSPPLPGWIANGGDPCTENWQGVRCVNSNITEIIINAANLGGQLGDGLGKFSDLSNNNIGGGIPENLPLTLRTFFLSANQFTGSIPSSLSQLTLLTDMSINNNQLSGDLPDVFSSQTGLINLWVGDLSFNNFSGPLPASMGNLSSLTTLKDPRASDKVSGAAANDAISPIEASPSTSSGPSSNPTSRIFSASSAATFSFLYGASLTSLKSWRCFRLQARLLTLAVFCPSFGSKPTSPVTSIPSPPVVLPEQIHSASREP